MPEEVQELLEAADEDVESDVIANSVNGDLHKLIAETRHFAAVLYAPGDAKVDDGNGKGLETFPPAEMRAAFSAWLS